MDEKKVVETSEVLIVFKRNKEISSVVSRLLPGFQGSCVPKLDGFGVTSSGKILVGYGRNIYEYKIKEKVWTNQFINVDCKVDVELGVGLETHVEGCEINDRQFIVCWESQVQLMQSKKIENNVNKEEKTNLLEQPGKHNKRQRSATFFVPSKLQNLNSKVCLTQLPVSTNGDTITRIGNNSVMFVGSYWVFKGELTAAGNDVTWKKLEFPKTPRRCHTAFMLRNNLYIAGGFKQHGQEFEELSSCERYDLKMNTWIECPHVLPYPLACATVSVSSDETFAVVIGGYHRQNESPHRESGRIIIFTESDGFQLLSTSELSSPKSSNHVSIRVQ